MQVLDVVAQRRKLDGVREELQQPGQVGLDRALAERDGDPERLLPACCQRLFQRDPQAAQPQGVEAVDMPDDQAPLALKQFAERQRQGSSCLPLLSTIRGFCKAAL